MVWGNRDALLMRVTADAWKDWHPGTAAIGFLSVGADRYSY